MNGFKENIFKYSAAVLGILCIGLGVAFNAKTMLGNDPVGIFYDGIRSAFSLEENQLGIASNIVNISLTVLLLLIAAKYINVGTLIYILPYGFFVSLGSNLYDTIFVHDLLVLRIVTCAAGCLILYFGVAIFVAADIGLDPMTGLAMLISDKFKWDFKRGKWLFDAIITAVGFVLGGKFGYVTLATALSSGPLIQVISKALKNFVFKKTWNKSRAKSG